MFLNHSTFKSINRQQYFINALLHVFQAFNLLVEIAQITPQKNSIFVRSLQTRNIAISCAPHIEVVYHSLSEAYILKRVPSKLNCTAKLTRKNNYFVCFG